MQNGFIFLFFFSFLEQPVEKMQKYKMRDCNLVFWIFMAEILKKLNFLQKKRII